MRTAFDAPAIYVAEAALMEQIPAELLMQRAASGLTHAIVGALQGRVRGRRVAVLVGSGNNGGDALFAGAALASRGAEVRAITVAPAHHEAGAAALQRAGGRLIPPTDPGTADWLSTADVVVDGIVGIGATGAVRPPAVDLLALIPAEALTVAVDIPSGVDPSDGSIADPAACVTADLTVTFGAHKSGQFLPPGRDRCGLVQLVDIGLAPFLPEPELRVADLADAAMVYPAPGSDDYKYSHGVLGVVAGSAQYPGAPHMVVGAARHAGVGMVRLWQDAAGAAMAAAVVERFPDTVCTSGPLADDPKATAWVLGPGMGTGEAGRDRVAQALATELPVVIDADALTLVSRHEELRAMIVGRSATTVLTPHIGEFARLGFAISGDDRLTAVRGAARELAATVVLKGPGTLVVDQHGVVFVDLMGTAALATAGTGDALAGLVGAAVSRTDVAPVEAVAAAVLLHGLAGRIASAGDRPITAWDVVRHVPDAVAAVRNV